MPTVQHNWLTKGIPWDRRGAAIPMLVEDELHESVRGIVWSSAAVSAWSRDRSTERQRSDTHWTYVLRNRR